MKTKWHCFLLIGLCLSLAIPLVSCAPNPTPERSESEELWQLLGEYSQELTLAEMIMKDKANEQAILLEGGYITTLEFRKRMYQVQLIHAHTIHYIDSKPQYAPLIGFLFFSNQEKPPDLSCRIPELASDVERRETQCEQYLTDYVTLHYWAIEEFTQTLKSYESEKLD